MENKYSDNKEYQTLDSFAKKTNRKLSFSDKLYKTPRPYRYPKYRTEVYIPNNENESSFFVCRYDAFFRVGEYSEYSGTFIPVSLPDTIKFNIRKRTIIDKFNTLFRDNSFKTNNSDFDSKVVINGNNDTYMAKYLGNIKIQSILLKSFEISQTMNISLNEIKNDFVPGLKNKSQIGIYDKQKWFMDIDQINKLFEIIEELRQIIK